MTVTLCFRTNPAWKVVIRPETARHIFTISETFINPFLYESKNILKRFYFLVVDGVGWRRDGSCQRFGCRSKTVIRKVNLNSCEKDKGK